MGGSAEAFEVSAEGKNKKRWREKLVFVGPKGRHRLTDFK